MSKQQALKLSVASTMLLVWIGLYTLWVHSGTLWAVAYTHRGQGDVSPRFQAEGDSHAKVPPPTFLTHNDAIAGFTSQSLGLPSYACKTDSSTAIKLAPRMHQNLPFWAQIKRKIFWPRPFPSEWTPPPHTPDSSAPLGLVPRARRDLSPTF